MRMNAFSGLVTALIVLAASSAVRADEPAAADTAAIKAAQDFRRTSWPTILADGWKFITSVNHPDIPDSGMDYFYRGLAPVSEEVRAAWVLHTYYQKFNVGNAELPQWQSEKWLVWTNCHEHSWQARGTGKYDSLTGSGPQVKSSMFTDTPWLADTVPATLIEVQSGTLADLLIKAICAENIPRAAPTKAPKP
jgi:hypothetical protein